MRQSNLPGKILETVGVATGPLSPLEIAKALPVGVEAPASIRKAIGRLVAKGRLVREGRGRYRLPSTPPVVRRTGFKFMEDEIAAFLETKGGWATTKAIHKAMGGWRSREDERPSEYALVVKVLRTSERFGQDFGWGKWNLKSLCR